MEKSLKKHKNKKLNNITNAKKKKAVVLVIVFAFMVVFKLVAGSEFAEDLEHIVNFLIRLFMYF
jgi:t-SNARE complex subunit (syntaxin)